MNGRDTILISKDNLQHKIQFCSLCLCTYGMYYSIQSFSVETKSSTIFRKVYYLHHEIKKICMFKQFKYNRYLIGQNDALSKRSESNVKSGPVQNNLAPNFLPGTHSYTTLLEIRNSPPLNSCLENSVPEIPLSFVFSKIGPFLVVIFCLL